MTSASVAAAADAAAEPDAALATWRATLRAGLDIAHAAGLEIGPLDNPVVARSEGAITYIDHADTAHLRDTYRDDPGVDIARIVAVDAVWGEQSLAACVGGATFDYVLASHVAEHVPDLITWLGEVHAVLKPQGQLRLVLPDHRFSFDALRDETRLLDVLTNWVLRARRPQVHNVLDFRLHYAPQMDCWARYDSHYDLSALTPAHDFATAIASADWARDLPDRYYDVHCWVFRPRSFALLMAQLAERGLLGFACADFTDTAPPRFEFFVFLAPCDDPARAAATWRAMAAAACDPLPGSGEARALAEQQARTPLVALGAVELERRLAAAQAQIAALQASTSWRITAPLRWAMRQFRPERS